MSRTHRPFPSKPAAQGDGAARLSAVDLVAAGASLIWLVGVIAYFFLQAPGDEGLTTRLLLVIAPLVAIAALAYALRTIRALKDERDALLLMLETVRRTPAPLNPAAAGGQRAAGAASPPARLQPAAQAPTAAQPDLLSSGPQQGDPATNIQTSPPGAVPVGATTAPAEQSDLGFGLGHPEDGPAPIAIDDFIRALNFPDNPDDVEGIRCLRLALEDREAARLIRSAQDVLTLLSQDGIYMDDLRPERSKPEVWRRFAAGERGRSIAALGGIRDRSSIALTTGRMRSDTIFRDAAHHFLRQFDRSFQAFERHAEDQDISELADSRTARAFMLLGRVTGVFD